MSFIGDMLGTKNTFQAQGVDQSLLGTAYNQDQDSMDRQKQFVNALGAQNGLGNQQDVFGMQRNLAGQLQNIGNGTGPNPALAQLNQATGQNIAAQGALMAGQRGASANSGLLARLAAQQGGALQQQAVGQGATLQAQQQLSALAQLQQQQGQMAGLANQQVNQQQTGLNSLRNAGLQEQSNLMGLQSNANQVNAGVAQQNASMSNAYTGAALNGIGAAFGSMGGSGGGLGGSSGVGTGAAPVKSSAGTWYGADGGSPNGTSMLGGGKVPGQPEVGHNSYKNDTVPAMLSPGEGIIDLNTLHDSGPVGEAARFVLHHINKRNQAMACGGQVHNYADGGKAPPMPDPQKAKEAWDGAQHGQSFSKGWENMKNEASSMMNAVGLGTPSPQASQNKANGGEVQYFANAGEVQPVSEGQQALDDAKGYWENIKSFGSKANDILFSPPGGDKVFYGDRAVSAPMTPQSQPSQNMSQQATPAAPQAPQGMDLSAFKPQNRNAGASNGQGNSQSALGNLYSKYDVNAGINMQEKGLKQEASYQDTMNQAAQKPMDDMHNQLVKMQALTEQNAFNHNADQQKIIDQMQKGSIDPNAYINNMGTGQKVSTAIGLILGGIGGGLTHQENPAMKFLQSQINNDVRAQEMNMGNKHTLLGALEKQYGDKQLALQSAQNIYSMKYENEMKELAAKNGSPLVQSRLLQALGPLEAQRQQNNIQMGMRSAALGQLKNGGDAAAVIPFIVPKEQETKALEQYGKLNELNKLHQDMRESAEHLHGKFMNGALSPNDTNSAKQAFAGAVQKISEGRYNGDAAQKIVDSLLPQTMDNNKSTYENKLKRMDDFFEAFRKEPQTFLNGLGVPTPKMPPRGRPVNQGQK